MLNPPSKLTLGMHLFGQFVKKQRYICPCWGENGQIKVLMAIYDKPLHFMVLFGGPLLIPPCKPILEECPGHWDALIWPICKKQRYIFPVRLKMAKLM